MTDRVPMLIPTQHLALVDGSWRWRPFNLVDDLRSCMIREPPLFPKSVVFAQAWCKWVRKDKTRTTEPVGFWDTVKRYERDFNFTRQKGHRPGDLFYPPRHHTGIGVHLDLAGLTVLTVGGAYEGTGWTARGRIANELRTYQEPSRRPGALRLWVVTTDPEELALELTSLQTPDVELQWKGLCDVLGTGCHALPVRRVRRVETENLVALLRQLR